MKSGMTKKPDNVRIAIPSDEEALFHFLTKNLYQENGMFSLSEAKVRQAINNYCNQRDSLIGLIEDETGIVGCVGLYIASFWYTDEYHLDEIFNFVREDRRCSNYAKDLIDFAKWCNENMNLVLMMGILSTVRTEAKVRLYSRRLQMIGAFFANPVPGKPILSGGFK